MNIKKGLMIGLAALGFSMSAQASEINIGGVVWDPDSVADFQSNGNLYESFAGSVGDFVTGFGVITNFNGTTVDTFCPGCELTYTFSLQLVDAQPFTGVPNLSYFEFDNVVFNMWVDNTPEYDELAPSLAAASDGNLFLSAVNNGLLVGTAFNLFDVNSINGSGNGFLDVTAGLAFSNFDTNGELNGSDLQFTSSFQDANIAVPGFPLFGTLDLSGNTIPEPTSIALLGLGLLGFAARRKA